MTREELNNDKQKEIFKEENREKAKKKFLKLIKYSIFFIIIFYTFSLYTTYISSGAFIIKENRIINSTIPDSFNGTKIIQFSDLHYGSNIDYDSLKEIVNMINERNPDLVFFTGDLIDKSYEPSKKEQEKIINELKKINASLGKYAVNGDEDKENYSTIMNQADFTILTNESEFIYNKKSEYIVLTGFDSLLTKKIDVSKSLNYSENSNSNDLYSIAIFHEPDSTDEILSNKKINLLLAGHSHNGDIRIPTIGSIIKKDGAKKYDQEYYLIDNSQLYISSGLGTKNDGIRLFCKPSINFFRISNF